MLMQKKEDVVDPLDGLLVQFTLFYQAVSVRRNTSLAMFFLFKRCLLHPRSNNVPLPKARHAFVHTSQTLRNTIFRPN
jgi:hypothetical protein